MKGESEMKNSTVTKSTLDALLKTLSKPIMSKFLIEHRLRSETGVQVKILRARSHATTLYIRCLVHILLLVWPHSLVIPNMLYVFLLRTPQHHQVNPAYFYHIAPPHPPALLKVPYLHLSNYWKTRINRRPGTNIQSVMVLVLGCLRLRKIRY